MDDDDDDAADDDDCDGMICMAPRMVAMRMVMRIR